MTRLKQPRTGGVSITHGVCDDAVAHMTSDVTPPIVDAGGTFSSTDPPRGAQAGSYVLLGSPPLDGDPSHGWPIYTKICDFFLCGRLKISVA